MSRPGPTATSKPRPECSAANPLGHNLRERVPFQLLPAAQRARLFGVDYALVPQADHAELYVSRVAWHWLDYLAPEHWRDGDTVRGQRLPGSTGTVYRATSAPPDHPPRDLVVKFSRVAQDVPLFIPGEFLESLPRNAVADARFLSPFAEFGLLHELRGSILNHGPHRLRTKMPLAIYSPPQKYPLWQTGRHPDIFRAHQQAMAHDQFENGLAQVTIDPERDYLMIYAWIDGIDAEEACNRGMIDEELLVLLSRSSNHALSRLGYRVLDNKPRHLIVRPRADGTLLQRNGKIVYTMIDFELLQRHEDTAKPAV